MDVLVIDNKNVLVSHIHREGVHITVHDDEIRALIAAEQVKHDIILLNYSVRNKHTVEYIALLCRICARSKIILIGSGLADDEILECLIAGAKGFLQIDEVQKFINKLLPAVQAGEAWISRRLVAKLIDKLVHQQTEHSEFIEPGDEMYERTSKASLS